MKSRVASVVKRMQEAGIHVSLFIDPDIAQIDCCKFLAARRSRSKRARYSEAKAESAVQQELDALAHSLHACLSKGLGGAPGARIELSQYRADRTAAGRAGTEYWPQHRFVPYSSVWNVREMKERCDTRAHFMLLQQATLPVIPSAARNLASLARRQVDLAALGMTREGVE